MFKKLKKNNNMLMIALVLVIVFLLLKRGGVKKCINTTQIEGQRNTISCTDPVNGECINEGENLLDVQSCQEYMNQYLSQKHRKRYFDPKYGEEVQMV